MIVANHDLPNIVGVEGVHILLGVDGLHHRSLVQALGQGGLNQDAMDILFVVKLVH